MYKFEVKNLSCGHCVATVTNAIQAQDPNAKVKVDLKTKHVSVESSAGEARLREVVAAAAYPAT